MRNFTTMSMVTILLAIMFWIFSVISSSGRSFISSGEATVALVFFMAAMCVLVWSIFVSSFSIVDMLVIYFLAVSVGFSGYYEVATEIFPWPVVHTKGSLIFAILIYAVFLIAYLAGNFAGGLKPLTKINAITTDRRFSNVMTTLLCLSVVCLAIGGPGTFTARADSDSFAATDGFRPQMIQIGKSLCLTVFLFLLCVWLDTKKYGRLTVFASVVMVICYNPITAPRFQFIAAVLSTLSLTTTMIMPSPTIKAAIYLGLFLANYIIFGPLKSLSAGLANFDSSAFSDIPSFISEYAFRVDFDAVQISANTVTYFDLTGGYNYGLNILGAAFFFVPRAIWPTKPIAETIEVHDALGYEYLNLSFPLPVEFYTSGGYFAVALLAFGCAYFIKRNSLNVIAGQTFYSIRIEQVVLLAIIAGYTPIIMRGALNAILPIFGFAFLAYFVVIALNRRFLTSSQSRVQMR